MNRAKFHRGSSNHHTLRQRKKLHIEPLEVREVPASGLALDFDTATSPTAAGYNRERLQAYTTATHMGWQTVTGMGAVLRTSGSALNRDFHYGRDATFLADVPNGTYDVVLGLGDAGARRDRVWVWAEGSLLASEVTTLANQFLQVRGRVTVADGRFTLRLADLGGVNPYFALDWLTLSPVNANAPSLWSSTQLPGVLNASDSQAVELGVRFRSSADGYITGIRFYKSSLNTGTHTGTLWTADGTPLASAIFTNETANGWQEVRFASPVAISANTTYVASYFAPRGRYAFDADYFAVSGISNGTLSVLPTRDGGGGTFVYGGGFPTQTYKNGNYWVDVVFAPETVPPTVTSVTPADGSTNVPTSTSVLVQFSEALDPATVNGNTVVLQTAAGAAVSATVAYDPVTFTATLTPASALDANAAYTVVVRGGTGSTVVRDQAGNALAADFTSVFTTASGSSPPTADAGADKSANEGSAVSFTGTASGGTGTLSYHWDFGDGGTSDGTLTPSHTFADNGSYTVSLTVTDANNQTASDTAVVTVTNVAPTATVSNDGPVNVGANVTISFANQNDVSSADRAAGYTYSYDFNNDGTWDQTDVTTDTATTSFATAGSKTVKARIKDKDGAFTDYTTTVVVNGRPTADAGADKSANEGSSVSFTGTASGGVGTLTYHWEFGDGGTSDGTLTPSHTYADNGTYTVTLTVTDGNNQTGSDTAVVTVSNVAPTGSVSNDGPVNVNANVTISFANQNDVSSADRAAGYRYSYDFNNDGTWDQADVTAATATTSFNTAGSKTVKARIKDKDGGFTDYTTTVVVNGPPTADAGADKSANEGSSVSFTGTAGGGVGALTYHWDFGDGGTSDGSLTPSHTFVDNGTYTVTLTVTDANSQTASDSATVTVSNVAPTATVSNSGPVYTNANVTISFANQNDVSSADRAAGYKYSYDFNNDGTWDQTDVASSTATTSFSSTGSQVVKARIKDKDGGFTDYTTTVVVNGPPVADAGADKSANEGSSVSFTGTASGGVGTLTYHWDFGDGGTSDGTLSPSHTFADNGSYTVTLTVTDANNQTGSDTTVVTVSNVAPTGSVSNNGPVYTNANVTISFANQNDVSSADRAAGYTYSYDFNNDGTWDQTDVTTATATTSYTSTGNKVVKARIKDKDGGFTDYTTTVSVNALPGANAGADKSANEASSVSFTGTATGGIGALTYHWDFGDGGTSDGTLTPSHTFVDNGSYTVTLTVTDGNNQVGSDTAVVTVSNVAPTATLSNNGPVNTNANVTISFANQNDVSSADRTAGYKYSYDFNNDGTWDQTDVTSATATTSFSTAGSKTVKARIKDKDGGFTNYTTTVTVNDPNSGHTYYVATTGSDTANGSAATPWKTLQKAANNVVAGDTVVVAAGTYVGFAFDPNVNNDGTSTNPITFIGNTGDYRTSAVIINAIPSVAGALSPVWLWNSGYIVVKGFNVTSNSSKGDFQIGGGSPGCQIISCHSYGTPTWGIKAGAGSDGIVIQDNLCDGSFGQHGIYVSGTNGYTIRGNVCRNGAWDGIHTNVEDGSNQINTNGLIEGNICFNNTLAGFDLTGMNNSVVRNNLAYGNGRHALVLQNSNGNATTACHHNVIVNNTFDATAGSSAYAIEFAALSSQPSGSSWTSNCDNTTVFNNILLGKTSSGNGAIGLLGTQPSTFRSDYNVVVNAFTKGSSSQTLAQWQSATGQDAHSFVSSSTALFTNPLAGDYTLKVGSLAIDAGTASFNGLSAPTTDIAGTSRPRGNGYDIGAYEL